MRRFALIAFALLVVSACTNQVTDSQTGAIVSQVATDDSGNIIQLLLDAILLIAIVAVIFGVLTTQSDRWRKVGLVGVGVLLVALVAALSMVIVPAGNVGIVAEFGNVSSQPLQPGLHFRFPFINNVTQMSTRVQGIHFKDLAAASREYQDVILTGTLNIHVAPETAPDLFTRVGTDYDRKLVIPFYSNLVKEVVPAYGIAEVLPKREEIRQRTVEKLTQKLAPYGIIVDDVAIENIAFSDAYTKIIEEKQVQEQRVLVESQILQQRNIQADQLVVQAKGEANAAIERARGQAEANRLLAQSLSDPVIQYQLIQKLGDKINVMLLPSDQSGLILDLKGLQPTP